jgi:hypothetical protein
MGVNQKGHFHLKYEVNVTQSSQPKGVKPKIRGHKLKICVNFQGALKHKSVKQTETKTRNGCTWKWLYMCISIKPKQVTFLTSLFTPMLIFSFVVCTTFASLRVVS